jgi:hypothetical protein
VFGRNEKDARKAEREQLRAQADAAMVAGQGVYNSNPWSFAPGIALAVFASLFLLSWLLRHQGAQRAAPAPNSSYEIDVEVE